MEGLDTSEIIREQNQRPAGVPWETRTKLESGDTWFAALKKGIPGNELGGNFNDGRIRYGQADQTGQAAGQDFISQHSDVLSVIPKLHDIVLAVFTAEQARLRSPRMRSMNSTAGTPSGWTSTRLT
jgi:hypothetical protein